MTSFINFLRELFSTKTTIEKKVKIKKIIRYKIIPSDLGKAIQFQKSLFLFDEEGFKLFQNKFNSPNYTLIKIPDKHGSFYLARKHKYIDKIDYFHRWYLYNEVKTLCALKKLTDYDVIVHHIHYNIFDNRKNNLRVMTRIEHDILHNRVTDDKTI